MIEDSRRTETLGSKFHKKLFSSISCGSFGPKTSTTAVRSVYKFSRLLWLLINHFTSQDYKIPKLHKNPLVASFHSLNMLTQMLSWVMKLMDNCIKHMYSWFMFSLLLLWYWCLRWVLLLLFFVNSRWLCIKISPFYDFIISDRTKKYTVGVAIWLSQLRKRHKWHKN